MRPGRGSITGFHALDCCEEDSSALEDLKFGAVAAGAADVDVGDLGDEVDCLGLVFSDALGVERPFLAAGPALEFPRDGLQGELASFIRGVLSCSKAN